MLIRRFALLVLILGLAGVCAQAQITEEPQKLESSKPLEREVAGGQSHSYQIKLAAGQFLRVIVEQKGIDVALKLISPDGKPLIESNLTDTLSAHEPLSYEAKAAGDYQIVIRANGAATLLGAYQVRLDVKAAATAQDNKRMAAEQLLIEAARLIHGKEFQPSIEKQQQALLLWRELGDRDWEGDTLRFIGGNYGRLSRYDKATEFYEQVLAIRRERKDRNGEANSLSDLGAAYERLSRFDKSLEYFEQALAINRRFGTGAKKASASPR